MKSISRGAVCAALAVATAPSPDALAGAFSREELNSTGLLFSNDRFVIQGQVLRVWPERSYSGAANGYPGNAGGTVSRADANPEYTTGSLAIKARLYDGVDCMARLHQPYGQHTRLGPGWIAGNQFDEQTIDARGFDGTCSYTFAVSDQADLRILGGIRLSEFDFQRDIGLPVPVTFALDSGLTPAWRAGLSYERPDIALRVTAIYNSPVEYDLEGAQSTAGFNAGQTITSTAEMPQSVELRVQSGIAPDWLASVGLRWEEWGAFSSLDVNNAFAGINPITGAPVFTNISSPTQFDDTWTAQFGIGHKISDKWLTGASLTWSQGAGGGYSDTWTLGAAIAYEPVDDVRIEISAALSRLTEDGVSGLDIRGTPYSYQQDGSWAYATGLRLRWSY